jgi:hypothetical protein
MLSSNDTPVAAVELSTQAASTSKTSAKPLEACHVQNTKRKAEQAAKEMAPKKKKKKKKKKMKKKNATVRKTSPPPQLRRKQFQEKYVNSSDEDSDSRVSFSLEGDSSDHSDDSGDVSETT